MPDWTYQTIFRPLLFRMPASAARSLTLRSIDTLSRVPFGTRIIRLTGHMDPPDELRRELLGLTFESPVGLDSRIAPDGTGLKALSHFEFGFLEIGTVMPFRAVHKDGDPDGADAIPTGNPCPIRYAARP
jgi:dihydroorotate dehydrogenase